ncbi:phage protein [Agaricicola taiwanensis]|uniref:Phage protein n=1 Tax=Agaricicola taiwanensis TaxID=591372 RepID=A0A8J3E0P0_9RHOB|nr:hypothetical protein [Agaricicola taiwanensis]GGE54427.1 phage protein [Agaricicola taiwanensis]
MADLRTIQPSFSGGELAPALWARTDTAKYPTGLKTARNVVVEKFGGVTNRAGLQFVAEVRDSARRVRIIPFQFNTEQTYILELGHEYMRVVMDGAQVAADTVIAITGVSQDDPVMVTAPSHGLTDGDEIALSGLQGMEALNGRSFIVADAATDSFTLQDRFGQEVDGSTLPAWEGGGEIRAIYEIASPYAEDELAEVSYVQEADVAYLTQVNHAPQKLSRTGHAAWTITQPTFTPIMTAPTGVTAARAAGSGSVTYRYKVSAVSEATGEESLPSAEATVTNNLLVAGYKNRVQWPAVTGAARYVVYRYDAGVFGYVGSTDGLQFEDENITPDLSDTTQSTRNPFEGEGNYPRCATFYEQRLAFAGTRNDPQAVWLSQSANYENFGVSSPAKASDAITFRVRAKQVNEIRAMVPVRNLMLFTSGAEWEVSGGNDEPLTPGNIRARPRSYWTSSTVPPLVIGNVVLFAVDRGGLRDFAYEFAQDGYIGVDLGIFSAHLFEGRRVVAQAYAQSPLALVWVVLDDGSLISLTYLREQEVWAWTRHDTDGAFEDVAVIAEGAEDAVYVVVRREVMGEEKRYIERLSTRLFTRAEDCFFVDSGLSYAGEATAIFSGLDHLEGKEVVALADGHVARGLTVTDGMVTLANPATRVHIGLPYESDVETLNLDLGNVQGLGSVQGRLKSVSSVTLRVERTRGLWVGPDASRLVEYKQRAGETWGEAIQLFTGDMSVTLEPDWNTAGSIFIRQSDPLPMTILGVMSDVTLGG